MPGFFSGLVRAGARGATGVEQGRYEGEQALVARALKAQAARLQQAQIDNYESEVRDRANKPAPAYHPTSRAEAEDFYKDTHPQKDTGPPPGSEEWYQMQDRVAGIRARHRVGANSRADIPIDKAISQVGQQISSNRADLNSVDRQMKGYEGKEVLDRRNVDPADIAQFVSDSTQFSGLAGQRRKLHARGDSLNTARDQMSAERNKVLGLNLGMSPTAPTAGAGGSGDGKPRTGVPPEAQALFNEAAAAFKASGDVDKYNKVVAAISRKYGLVR
jgi:hypothetical protein